MLLSRRRTLKVNFIKHIDIKFYLANINVELFTKEIKECPILIKLILVS